MKVLFVARKKKEVRCSKYVPKLNYDNFYFHENETDSDKQKTFKIIFVTNRIQTEIYISFNKPVI